MDADSDLHLAFGQIEGVPSAGGQVPRRERGRHTARVLRYRCSDVGNGVERIAPRGRGAGDLLHENGRAGAAPPRPVRAGLALGGDVVGDHDGPRVHVGQGLAGHLEVHHVAGVILHDMQHAGALVRPACGLGDLHRIRGGEHVARARGGEHPGADESGVHRLVPGTSAGDHGDGGGAGIGDYSRGPADESGLVPLGEPTERLGEEVVRRIAEAADRFITRGIGHGAEDNRVRHRAETNCSSAETGTREITKGTSASRVVPVPI